MSSAASSSRARGAAPETDAAFPATGGPARPALHWAAGTESALPGPARATAAARAFSEGNGYLTGEIVDRLA